MFGNVKKVRQVRKISFSLELAQGITVNSRNMNKPRKKFKNRHQSFTEIEK